MTGIRPPRILYVAPLKDFSGYATAARNYVRALDSVGADLVTRCLHYDGGDAEFSEREKELNVRSLQGINVVLQHTTPNETEYKPGLFNINYFAWETDKVPYEWVEQINKMDLALVPCDENIRAARRSGVTIPIEKVVHTFDAAQYDRPATPFQMGQHQDAFKFLAICQLSEKKGVDALLKSYLTEFTATDNVVLILKVYFGSNDSEQHKNEVLRRIEEIKKGLRLKNYPPVWLVHGVMGEAVIPKLYKTADCYVLPSRGEGWGIPHFDALGYGLPSIAVNWGGPTEFITSECGWLVDYHLSPCFNMPHPHDFMYTAADNWAEPHINSVRSAMREAHQEWKMNQLSQDNSAWIRRCRAARRRAEDFSYAAVGKEMNEIINHYYLMWRLNGAA